NAEEGEGWVNRHSLPFKRADGNGQGSRHFSSGYEIDESARTHLKNRRVTRSHFLNGFRCGWLHSTETSSSVQKMLAVFPGYSYPRPELGSKAASFEAASSPRPNSLSLATKPFKKWLLVSS